MYSLSIHHKPYYNMLLLSRKKIAKQCSKFFSIDTTILKDFMLYKLLIYLATSTRRA
jgi:hypothetical protein